MNRFAKLTFMLALAGLLGCTNDVAGPGSELDVTKADPLKADSSAEALFLDFRFSGELITGSSWNPESQIEDQLLYTVGQLNGDNSVSRLDSVALDNVQVSETDDGRVRITYEARLPVAWGKRNDIPATYDFQLPRDISSSGQTEFTEKYSHSCVDPGAHDVTSGIYWYYYRPSRYGCEIDQADVNVVTADVGPSPIQTTGKFPEYDEVWEDGVLEVVAVFGKYEDGATSDYDAGISAYNTFVRETGRKLSQHTLTTDPAEVPDRPGVGLPEVTFEATLADGRRIVVHAILVDNVRTAGREFDERYAALTPTADLIAYNGHSGLGANIRALASKGDWVAGQYAIVFMNGCDTYAYVDDALWTAHAEVNPDDPAGTKYLDIVMNAMPSFFSNMPHATLALVDGLADTESPRTYEQIFADISSSQVVLVSGEQDNTYVPGGGTDPDEPPPASWDGMSEAGAVARGEEIRFETPVLPAGSYRFEMTGSGDADLYVRIGNAPTQAEYDCRPYKSSSNEACDVELPAGAPIHLMVRGYSDAEYQLSGSPR